MIALKRSHENAHISSRSYLGWGLCRVHGRESAMSDIDDKTDWMAAIPWVALMVALIVMTWWFTE